MTTGTPAAGRQITVATEPAAPLAGHPEMLAVLRWQAAEGRLYPLATVDAVLYEEAVTLVREAAEVLRSRCTDVAELVEADPREVLACCPSAPASTECGLDPSTAFDAARALRWRELSADRRGHAPDPGDPR